MKHQTSNGIIAISDQMTGKMSGMQALSTSPLLNPNCLKNKCIENSICKSCYSYVGVSYKKNLRLMLEKNTATLTTAIIPTSELPFINHFSFRFESHGDIVNDIQMTNYVNLAKKNPQTMFALWTKNINLVESFFDTTSKPKNFIVVYSSLMLNKELKLSTYKHVDKIFTVFSKEFIAENKVEINCGAKSCLTCQICYKKNTAKYVREHKK